MNFISQTSDSVIFITKIKSISQFQRNSDHFTATVLHIVHKHIYYGDVTYMYSDPMHPHWYI